MHTSASLQETDEGDINRGQLSADVVSLWHAAKSIGFMTTQVILFCRLGISLGKPRSRCAQTAWKGPGNDVTYISDGAFGDRTKKEGQLQPTAPLFQLP